MNESEFSNQFDVLYNNITSNQAPGLNIYEKSVFLTKAEYELVKNYFNPKSNAKQEGFDDNPKRQIDFSVLTTVHEETPESDAAAKFDPRSNSVSVTLPSDIMMIINERVEVERGEGNTVLLTVDAINFEEYDRLMSKPFKRPLNYKAWRLINNSVSNTADLIVGPSDTISKYIVRYIRKPKPIILGDLDGLTIDGYSYTPADTTLYSRTEGTGGAADTYDDTHLTEVYENVGTEDHPVYRSVVQHSQGCELPEYLHEEILQRAVELAKIAWSGDVNATLQAGARSE